MPTPLTLLSQATLGEINVGAKAAALVMIPLLAQLDLMLGAEFGLGQLKLELQAQLQAALDLSVSMSNPAASLEVAIAGALAAIAQMKAQLAAGITLPQISFNATFEAIAVLQAKLGGIQLMLDAALQVRIPAANLVGQLQAALNFGPVALYGATGQSLAALVTQVAGNDYQAQVGIGNSDTVDALLLMSKTPGFRAAASVLFLMPPA